MHFGPPVIHDEHTAVSVSVFGGSTNYVVNWLIAATGDRLAPAYYLAAFSLVGTIAAVLLPETRGRDLDAESEA